MLTATISMDPQTQANLLALSAELTGIRREVTVALKPSIATVPPPRSSRTGAR